MAYTPKKGIPFVYRTAAHARKTPGTRRKRMPGVCLLRILPERLCLTDVFVVAAELIDNAAVRLDLDDAVCDGLDELVVVRCENSTSPLKSISPSLTAVMDSRSRWLVG